MQVVAHNLLANFSSRQLKTVTNNKEKNVERLSTGYKINRSSDDAAGLTISEKMRWQIRGLDKCDQNVQDGISLLQVADGAMDEISSMLHRLKELSIQGLNDTNTETDVAAIQQEMNAIVDEIDSIAEKTTFNGIPLLQGDYERVTEKTITTTTEPQTVKMRYTENSILPSWVSVNGVAADQLTGTDAGKMIMNNTQISVGTTQDTTLIKYVSDSTDPTKITEKSNWTPELNDNFAGVIDFSFLSSVNGTTDITVTDDVNGDGNVDASDKISVSNLYLKLSELVNTGFSTQCCTCTEPYGVLFSTKDRISEITEIPGITDGKNNGIQVIYIDDLLDKASNDPTAGQAIAEELVQRMLDEKGGGSMTHFTRYTKDAANPAKLVVYDFRDNEPDVAGPRINAEFLLKKTTKVTIPAQTNNFTYYEVDDGLMIQTGASKDDSVAIHLYDVSSGRYGLNLRGNVELIESKYSYSTTSTTRTENYSYKEPIKNTKYIPGYTYFNAHGERVNVGAKMEVEITGWNTIVGTRTITTQEKTLIGVTQEKNPKVLDNVDSALNKLNSVRTTLGAYQNRLEHTKQVDNNTQENTQAAESRIRDTDMAEEMVDYSKHNILEQAGQSMLAQANQSAQGVLQLLG